MITYGILTASDKGSRGEREDRSGQTIRELLSPLGAEAVRYEIVPDDKEVIARTLVDWADNHDLCLIFTTGGTGLGPRDVTPDATLSVIDKLVPGIAEVMRAESLKKTEMAMLSRAVAGVRGRCLIVNLPGSPKAVRECLEAVLPALPHAVEIMRGQASECATRPELHRPAESHR